MAQESDSSTPSSSSESGWKVPRASDVRNEMQHMILLPLIPCDLEDIARYMTQPAIYDFCTLVGKDILTSHQIYIYIYYA